MGRRRRKTYKKVKPPHKRIPKVFQCPACGLPTLIIDLETYYDEVKGEERKRAYVKCMNPECGLRATLDDLPTIYSAMDAYSKFLDAFTEETIEVRYEPSREEREIEE